MNTFSPSLAQLTFTACLSSFIYFFHCNSLPSLSLQATGYSCHLFACRGFGIASNINDERPTSEELGVLFSSLFFHLGQLEGKDL